MSKLSKREQKTKYAAIAQSVERILGKDEVASSNLASSSKPLKLLEFQGFFLFLTKSHDLILHIKILIWDEVIIMKKIEMPTGESKNFLEVFEMFVISQAAKGGPVCIAYHEERGFCNEKTGRFNKNYNVKCFFISMYKVCLSSSSNRTSFFRA